MKKSVVFFALLFCVSLGAQTRVTKTSVIGKWKTSAIDMGSMFYYDLAKDSVAWGETLKKAITSAEDTTGANAYIKGQISRFSRFKLQFNTDGTAQMSGMVPGSDALQSTTYEVDEAKSIIVNTKKGTRGDPLNADMLGDKLRIKRKVDATNTIIIVMTKE
jgi:hypothetical protein